MKNLSLDDLRADYERVTSKRAAVRWNRRTLEKKIRDARIIQAAEQAEQSVTADRDAGPRNPEFERMAGDIDIPLDGSSEYGGGDNAPDVAVPDGGGRGGPRPGAGRPPGQTDERARIERLMALEVPDLAIDWLCRLLNVGFAKVSACGFTDDERKLISLGLTKVTYCWFPDAQGRMNKLTLHLDALEGVLAGWKQRAVRVRDMTNEKQDLESVQNGKENEKGQDKEKDEAETGSARRRTRGRAGKSKA